ncbi:DUF1152 domain-containing protein [Methylomonas sp. TEB]|uniref:DUF1152 domain-containing protein n=1 Tax=Methylomonas sp. TEB TaxID=3398229 RepID=UPI0039F48921
MNIPFFDALVNGQRFLIAGVGGGFDIVSGVPIYLYLRRLGKQVTMANLSFTELGLTNCEEICPGAFLVNKQSADLPYFPERYILEWLSSRGEESAMYAFSNEIGVLPLRSAYAEIVERHQIDTLVLVDGGTDSLIFGDEPGIGTVVEDACSMIAASGVAVKQSLMAMVGFGIDHFHDVNHHACLENIATLIKDDGYLGAFSLTKDMYEGRGFLELVDYLNQNMRVRHSIVTNSVASAIKGEFGDHQVTSRTSGSELFINPLMSLYWTFSLSAVVRRMGFAEKIENTTEMDEVAKLIRSFRIGSRLRDRKRIPL